MLYIRVAGRIDDRVKYHGGRATRWASGKQRGRQVEQRGRYEVGVGVASWLPDLEEKKKVCPIGLRGGRGTRTPLFPCCEEAAFGAFEEGGERKRGRG